MEGNSQWTIKEKKETFLNSQNEAKQFNSTSTPHLVLGLGPSLADAASDQNPESTSNGVQARCFHP